MRVVFELKRDAVPEVVPEQPVQDDAAAGVVRRQHAGDRRRAAADAVAASEALRPLHRAPPRGGHPPHAVRSARGPRPDADRRGARIAVDNIDAVIEIIRSSKDTEAAKSGLMQSFDLSAAPGPGDPRHAAGELTGLEREKLMAEYSEVGALIAHLEDILANETKLMGVDRRRARGDQGRVRRRAPHRDRRRSTREIDVEELIAPRRWWSPSPTAATSSAAPRRCTGRSGAAGAASPAPRRTRTTSSPSCSWRRPTTRC